MGPDGKPVETVGRRTAQRTRNPLGSRLPADLRHAMPKSHWIKIDRALEHIEVLDRSIEAWLRKDPYSIREEREPYDPDPALVRVSLCLRLSEPFRVEWSAYIGDAVHCLRSSLDHMAFTLNAKGYAKANNGAALPPRDAKLSEFPIFGNADAQKGASAFANAIKTKLPYASQAAIDAIGAMQPYQYGPRFTQSLLWMVHDLDIIDKHRQIVLASTAPTNIHIDKLVIAGPQRERSIARTGPMKDGDELAYWVIAPETQYHHNMDVTFHVAFGNGTTIPGWPVQKTLRDMHTNVKMIASALDSEF